MTPAQAVELAGRWPADRTVPKQLAMAYQSSSGDTKQMIGHLDEALMVACKTGADMELVASYFP